MEAFIAFFAKYWLTFVFGLIGSGITVLVNKLIARYKRGKEEEEKENLEPFKK